jgi:RNA polymerase sigma factor (sigma-70 family)
VPTVPLDPARQELAARVVPLAHAIASRYRERHEDLGDEFLSATQLAVVHAAASYDLHSTARFSTYAWRKCHWACRDVLRRAQRNARVEVLHHDPYRDDDHGQVDELEAFEARIRPLPRRHRTLFRLIFIKGLNKTEASKRMGLSQARVSVLYAQGVEMLAADVELAEEGHAECSC